MDKDKKTTKGAPLKKLRNITCPYTGIQMISGRTYNNIVTQIRAAKSLNERLHLVARYQKNMQSIEKTIFERFWYYHDLAPNKPSKAFFDFCYEEAYTKTILAELGVLDKIDLQAQQLSAATQLEVRRNTTNTRKSILDGKPFKRKDFIYCLDAIKPKTPFETTVLSSMINESRFLPNSSTNTNSFIVKYAGRSETEFFERLLLPSVATIEHICPSSTGGSGELSNFMLASLGANKLRENMSLDIFVSHYPQIPDFVQIYIDEIVICIKRGLLTGHNNYPVKVAQTLEKESLGKIAPIIRKY